jgi:collagen type IX alpha
MYVITPSCICVNRDVFPLGVPQQFSFIATFSSRMMDRTQWYLLTITDDQNIINLQITLNQVKKIIEFSIVNYEGYLQTVTFEAINVS